MPQPRRAGVLDHCRPGEDSSMDTGQDVTAESGLSERAGESAERHHVADSGEQVMVALAGVGEDAPSSDERQKLAADLPADRYLDREESWLRFSQRVLELAEDPGVPLLERVRF